MLSNKHLIVIAGPTAVGKTDVSIRLAKELDTEIISVERYKGIIKKLDKKIPI